MGFFAPAPASVAEASLKPEADLSLCVIGPRHAGGSVFDATAIEVTPLQNAAAGSKGVAQVVALAVFIDEAERWPSEAEHPPRAVAALDGDVQSFVKIVEDDVAGREQLDPGGVHTLVWVTKDTAQRKERHSAIPVTEVLRESHRIAEFYRRVDANE